MSTDWSAKAEAYTYAVRDVEAMVAAAEARADLTHADAVRLAYVTARIVEVVEGLISGLKESSPDPNFMWTLASLLRILGSADRRAAQLVLRASNIPDRTGEPGKGTYAALPKRRAPQQPWFPGRMGYYPGKLSLKGDMTYGLDVVVGPFEQDALDALCGPRTEAGARKETYCMGELLPETRNLYDPSAVAVFVSGLKVGHLPPDDARRFREAATTAGVVRQSVDVDVLVIHGGPCQGNISGSYRAKIDAILPFEFASRSGQGVDLLRPHRSGRIPRCHAQFKPSASL